MSTAVLGGMRQRAAIDREVMAVIRDALRNDVRCTHLHLMETCRWSLRDFNGGVTLHRELSISLVNRSLARLSKARAIARVKRRGEESTYVPAAWRQKKA